MASPEGLHIVPNRVTVSTAGVVPRILDLASVPDRPHLAISLAAPTNELRNQLMPINKKWPLEELLSACKEFEKTLRPGERFTFEYVMLRGVNDSEEQARQLANLLNRYGMQAKVNLIPHNPADPLHYQPSSEEKVARFRSILEAKVSTPSCGVRVAETSLRPADNWQHDKEQPINPSELSRLDPVAGIKPNSNRSIVKSMIRFSRSTGLLLLTTLLLIPPHPYSMPLPQSAGDVKVSGSIAPDKVKRGRTAQAVSLWKFLQACTFNQTGLSTSFW